MTGSERRKPRRSRYALAKSSALAFAVSIQLPARFIVERAMETEVEVQVKTTPTPSPPPSTTARGQTTAIEKQGSPSAQRKDSLRRGSVRRAGSLRRDQLTGEKRRSRTGSLGSLMGYEAKFPVSCGHSMYHDTTSRLRRSHYSSY